jgi:transposase
VGGRGLLGDGQMRFEYLPLLVGEVGLVCSSHDARYPTEPRAQNPFSDGFLQQFALALGRMHHASMNAYSEDLRKKIVEAKERGMPTTEVARAFGVGLSSVKRYAKLAREGGSLRPKKSSPGRRPKADESARMLLEADLEEREAATLAQRREYLRSVVAGLRVSESTVSRLLRRLGWTRKKDQWVRANATVG